MKEFNEKENIYKYILDESNQLVAIALRKDYRLLYVNKPLIARSNNNMTDYHNKTCYEFMGVEKGKCSSCPLKELEQSDNNEIEFSRNNRTYHVKMKNIDWMGCDAFIIYATDITLIKRAQEIFETQMQLLIQSIPDAEGVFHFNVTKDKWISSMGQSGYIEKIQNMPDVDSAIVRIADFIPDTDTRDEFIRLFSRENMLETYNNGVPQLVKEVRSFYDDGSIKWARMTARLIMNPKTGDLECVLYGMDISGEKEYEHKIELEKEEKKVILEKSRLDMLTGLYSKTAFIDMLTEYLNQGSDVSYGVIFLDVDHFKDVNDTLGHIIGDRLIIRAAKALKEIYDSDDVVARFGGDEFCVLAKGITKNTMELKLEHVIERFDTNISESGKSVHISASIGVLFHSPDMDSNTDCDNKLCAGLDKDTSAAGLQTVSAVELIGLADEALYQAKRNGRNQYCMVYR